MRATGSSDAPGRTRVLFVHHRSELGGAPTSLSYLIGSLGPDFEAHVYCPPGAAADLFRAVGATVHTGPVSSFTHIWASVYRGRRWLLFLRDLGLLPLHIARFSALLARERFDLVHLNDSPLLPAAWLSRRAGIPVVWHLRSSLPDDGTDLRSRLLRAAIRRLASHSIAITDDVAAIFNVGATVVPNSVDLELFKPGDGEVARAEIGVGSSVPVVSYFGFIYPSKGFREFIESAARLRDEGVQAQYLVVGGAVRGQEFFHSVVGRGLQMLDLTRNYEAEAKRLVAERGLQDAVRFIPFTQETAVLYQASDIVVAPSRGPELGRPVIEAAASGVPVIATGSRTGAGVVQPGETGVLVDDDTVESLCAAIRGLIDLPGERAALGRQARLHAEKMFDPSANARKVERIYDALLPGRGRIPILFVHHRPQLGGAPSSLAHLIRRLRPRFQPHVFCPAGPAADLFAEAGAVVHTGKVSIFAHAWDSPYEGARWLVLAREIAALGPHVRQLGRLMRTHRFPLVHLNDSPLLAAAWVAHRNGAKVVWHLRSALAGEGRDLRSRLILSLMERWGDAAIAIDSDVAERFRFALPTTVVHNSVAFPAHVAAGSDAKQGLGLPMDRLAVGFAGFVRRQKGWPELVEAASILATEGVPVHFAIMGGGVRSPAYFRTLRGRALAAAGLLVDEESAIKHMVETRGLDDYFTFLPFTADTGAVYSALDVVTFPNQGVGLGRPVLEASMFGKPVIASGSRDGAGVLLPQRTGLLLDEPTPERIAQAIRLLIEDAGLRERMGRAAAEHARRTFDPLENAAAVERVYEQLLGLEPETRAESAEPEVAVPA